MKKNCSECFGEDYYEKVGGYKIRGMQTVTLGDHGNYNWDHPGQQNELAKKWGFITKRLREAWKNILFVGCGKGFELAFFQDKGKEVYGIDFSEYVIDNIHSDIRHLVFREDICETEFFGEDEVDVVASFDVLALVAWRKRKKAVKNISRMAKKYVVIRTKVLGSKIKSKRGPDMYDGTPVYLEPPWYWVQLFEKYGKFRLQEAMFYRPDFSKIWMVFKRK